MNIYEATKFIDSGHCIDFTCKHTNQETQLFMAKYFRVIIRKQEEALLQVYNNLVELENEAKDEEKKYLIKANILLLQAFGLINSLDRSLCPDRAVRNSKANTTV